ncbi:Na+/H+ antiporter subunit A [Nesterenkonia sp. HG001]|uniref:Na+/H+ antiporter subunit A n=1 Tax=Nesterenkonia sp. HG001 TaxID=2983207 RepID=UPI002AC4985C|nr:Na+/H+ antiporter subunit A [Nesterenkonia sp. HG001]MDZ5077504.1 Na+/H+ antiporter subunit A [Nesterenkonia sp. HG001]
MLLVLAVLFAVSLAAPWLFRRFGRSSFHILAAISALAMVWVLTYLPQVLRADQGAPSGAPNAPPSEITEWIPELGVEIAFRVDALALVMSLLILGVGALVLLYCARYFRSSEASAGPFAGQLFAFAAAMLGLVLSDDLVMLFIFWELTTVLSFLLIGYSAHRLLARRSAIQALVVTTFGGLAMLVGLLWLGELAGSYRLSEILASADQLHGTAADVALFLILVGALSKSALVPFHFWLPAAMAAPTPVSAYLHAAAMVKAGVYLVARMAPGFHETALWMPTVLGVGLATMLVGAWRALRQTDIKLVLAYGTVSQLGFLVMINGLGTEDAALAGLAMLLAHGLFKAALFMVVGIIDHETGTRDLTRLSGLGRTQRALFWISAVSVASMAGLPPLFGFVAKEVVFESFYGYAEVHPGWGWVVMVGVVVASALTVAYSARFLWGAFGTKRGATGEPLETTHFHAPAGAVFLAAPALLAVATVLLALWPAPVQRLIDPFVSLFHPVSEGAPGTYLALWHGLTPVLGLSVLAWGLGLGLFAVRERFGRLQQRTPAVFDAERGYRSSVKVLDVVAVWLTSVTQRGSLAWYLFIIIAVATGVVSGVLLFTAHQVPQSWIIAEQPLQLVLAVVIVAGAIGAVWAPKRFMAVLMVSLCGYGIAGLFALQGAPDLALTVLLVESIVLVVFVLALRNLPAGIWTQNPARFKIGRVVLGIGFGLAMMGALAVGMDSRVAVPISEEFPWMAYEVGQGANIVNVTLVDIRVWDTFGEITVLAVAATGVASLIFVKRRDARRRSLHEVPTGSVGRVLNEDNLTPRQAKEIRVARSFSTVAREAWLVAGRTVAPEHRSIIFEVVTRLMFHAIILLSLYLLLAGHNLPGGGFAGGLLAGLALTLRYLAGGRYELEAAVPFSASSLMGWGLALACSTGLVSLLAGGHIFQSAMLDVDLPVFGEHHVGSAIMFDVGVYLVVVGLILDILRSLGSEIDVRSEMENRAAERGDPYHGHGLHSETTLGVAR